MYNFVPVGWLQKLTPAMKFPIVFAPFPFFPLHTCVNRIRLQNAAVVQVVGLNQIAACTTSTAGGSRTTRSVEVGCLGFLGGLEHPVGRSESRNHDTVECLMILLHLHPCRMHKWSMSGLSVSQ